MWYRMLAIALGMGPACWAGVRCEVGRAAIDGVVIGYGTEVECVGECVEKKWEDISPTEGDLRLVRIDGRGNQDRAVLHLNGLGKGQELKPGTWYRVRGKLNDGWAHGSSVLFSMGVEKIEVVAAAPLTVGDFVGRSAELEGTAVKGGVLRVEAVDVRAVQWPEKVIGKHVGIRGLVRKNGDGFQIELPEWRLLDPADMVGTTVTLEGSIWSMNDVFGFRYREWGMIVTDAKDHPIGWGTAAQGGPARVTGLLVEQLRPSLEQISLKEDRDLVPTFVIRRAKIEYTEPELNIEERFRSVYPAEYKVSDGVPVLIAQDIVRRNIMGDETAAHGYVDFNRRVIETVLANATPATLDVLGWRMDDATMNTGLRLVYVAMLAAANDERGRKRLAAAVESREGDVASAVYCLGAFDSLMPEGAKIKTQAKWAEPVMVKLMTEKDGRGRYVSAPLVSRVSEIPDVLARMDTPGARRALVEYAIATIDPPTNFFRSNVLRMIAARGMAVSRDDLMRLTKSVKDPGDRRSILHLAVHLNDAAVVEMFLPELGENNWFESELEGPVSPEILKVLRAHELELGPKAQSVIRHLLMVNQKDLVPDLIKALKDPGEREKNWVVWEMIKQKDGRCVGPVMEVLRSAPAKYFGDDGLAGMLGTEHAIDAVAASGTRESIAALIELLDVDVSRFGGYDREGGRRIVAARLIDITGESFGTDAAGWREWAAARGQ